ncbi:MAG: DNA mismatch repair endonuclease MutL [Clostridiales bacterium]|nr:DNA mismatch repair endonuclease MutL [Clostridiales bacterium]
MPKINVLPKQIVDLIAAGEVVERPASVVKELMENSLDAGATSITVEIKNGGIKYIRITDNGCGIDRSDIRNAFVSHATSKISREEDLDSIFTLGFRGEALASVAAVASVDVMTRAAGSNIGTHYRIEGGEEQLMDDAGCPVGTTIVVRDLFFNTPARMKFLKKDVTEANAVAAVVDRIALSHPETAVRFIRDDKEVLRTEGKGDLGSAVYSVLGKEFFDTLIPVNYELEGVRAEGFISKPTAARPNRNMQYFFLNGRFIKTGTGSAALSEAYKNSIMAGKFPACVLNIILPPHTVDVNVHPSKIEVRFANDRPVFNAVYYGAKNALTGGDFRPRVTPAAAIKSYIKNLDAVTESKQMDLFSAVTPRSAPAKPAPSGDFWQKQSAEQFSGEFRKPEYKKTAGGSLRDSSVVRVERDTDLSLAPKPEPVPPAEVRKAEPEKAKTVPDMPPRAETPAEIITEAVEENYRYVGELFKTYLLVENGDKMLIIDKHAAHERMIFNELKNRQSKPDSQLIMPVTVSLSKEEYSAVVDNLDLLSQAGYGIDDFGSGTVIVRECPLNLSTEDVEMLVVEIAGHLISNKQDLTPAKLEWLYDNLACRAAIKAGDLTSDYEAQKFVERLMSMPEIKFCPHGRPVMIEMTRREMEKSFGRNQ